MRFHSSDEDGVTMFIDNGIHYMTGGERTDQWMWMEDVPQHLENHR